MTQSIPVLNLPEKMYYYLFQEYICYYVLFALSFGQDMVHFSQTEFPVLILLVLLL